jgi:hypothetical protein
MTNIFSLNNSSASLHFGCASMLNLLPQVKEKVKNNNSIIAFAINAGIDNNLPAKIIFKEIGELAQDNYQAMANLLGTGLLTSIINLGHV